MIRKKYEHNIKTRIVRSIYGYDALKILLAVKCPILIQLLMRQVLKIKERYQYTPYKFARALIMYPLDLTSHLRLKYSIPIFTSLQLRILSPFRN